MTVEMKILVALMIITATASVSFALKMTWENLRENSVKTAARKDAESVRFGSGPALTGNG